MTRRFWITGARDGLGLALVNRALEQGHQVAASGRDSQTNDPVLSLPGQLHDSNQASLAGQRVQQHWGALDTLLVNAGTCAYLDAGLAAGQLFEAIARSNFTATTQCLNAALPLLAKGEQPQVMVVLSRHAAQQLSHPTQPPSAGNSLSHWLREQRGALQALGIDLTVVAPQPLNSPLPLAMSEDWTPEQTARTLLERLALRQPELVLEVLDPAKLWPLSH